MSDMSYKEFVMECDININKYFDIEGKIEERLNEFEAYISRENLDKEDYSIIKNDIQSLKNIMNGIRENFMWMMYMQSQIRMGITSDFENGTLSMRKALILFNEQIDVLKEGVYILNIFVLRIDKNAFK